MDKTLLEPVLHLFKVVRAYAYLAVDSRACLRHLEYGNFCGECLDRKEIRAENRARRKIRRFERRATKGFEYVDFLSDL